ncbi:hypothetical protein Mp_4g13200 [Marchantia polymorpha subsp. ruderalis]|uniref:Helicase ATP-binding domain-containing protein n=1 Tax=Marchantia polymorpha subsp. ruderalis TaxID=1480154 RepID=A0AAF6B9F9_MARPO|nr:hypothetical protein Mp_4g13200 [Marchantia polymorpha subsp. ruderalis]
MLSMAGKQSLFPVQMAVWHETVGPGLSERDVCVSSPTGSGKTLSYALPIVQKLSSRVIRLLRVLVVLPTRDLAAQVKAVFDTIAPAVVLSVGLAVGQTSTVAEAAELVQIRKSMVHSFGKNLRLQLPTLPKASKALAKFRNGQAQMLIASDAMTRGMDVEGVANVVNYDMPVYAKTYVRHFKQMLKKVDNSKCKDYSLPSSVIEELYESYTEALEKLKQITADEAA